MRWLGLFFLLFFISCSREEVLLKLNHERSDSIKREEALNRTEDTKELFCFKCHSYERFTGGERFPHSRHKGFYHCNQCHRLRMHKSIVTDTSICKTCHGLGRFTYTGSGMKTYFDHAGHSKRNSCRDCHPSVFVMKRGMNKITMDEINKGKSCGVCHNGKRAFGSENCNVCHEMG